MIVLGQIVKVAIDRQTKGVRQAGFGTALALVPHSVFSERIRWYTDAESVAADFWNGSPAHEHAKLYFMADPAPTMLAIGRQKCDDVTFKIAGAQTTAKDFVLKINGIVVKYSAASGATAATIQAGLIAANTAATTGATMIAVSTDSVKVSQTTGFAAVTGDASLISVSAQTVTEAPDVSLSEIKQVDNGWFTVNFLSRTVADILKVAAWVETQASADSPKFFVTASSDKTIGDTTTLDIAAQLKALGYFNTATLFTQNAGWPEAGLSAVFLPRTPGTYTVMFKRAPGLVADVQSATVTKNARDKNALTFEEVADNGMFIDGKVAAGEFIDNVIGTHWTRARMAESIFGVLINQPKVPFTDIGLTPIDGAGKAVLAEGVTNTLWTNDPAPWFKVPKANDVPQADRLARKLTGVKWWAKYAGAVHFVEIQGTVTV